jgi:hypothetical protein
MVNYNGEDSVNTRRSISIARMNQQYFVRKYVMPILDLKGDNEFHDRLDLDDLVTQNRHLVALTRNIRLLYGPGPF